MARLAAVLGPLRYLLGSSSLRFRQRVRRAARRPACPAIVPRPRRRRRSAPQLRLACALVASDDNPRYLEFWPLVRRAWREIVGIDALLVLVAAPETVPAALRADPSVILFRPVDQIHTSFQAQCIRLLYPALLNVDGAVLISDIDDLPLSRDYFVAPLSIVGDRDFVTYRDVLIEREMLAMWCNAASPATWGELFGISSLDDARARLATWAATTTYTGSHGGEGWYTDQQVLYRRLVEWGNATRRAWIMPDGYCGFQRLDRADLAREGGLSPRRRRDLLAGRYSDYHCLLPHSEHRTMNELVLELALAHERERR